MEHDNREMILLSVSNLSFQILPRKIECQGKAVSGTPSSQTLGEDSLLLRIRSAKGLILLIPLALRNKVFSKRAHSHPC